MAAITNVPRSMVLYVGVASTQQNDFNLDAGAYGITATAGVFGTATLQRLLPDGANANYVPVTAAIVAAGYTRIGLPAGQYRWVFTGMTALTLVMELIAPGRQGGS